MNVWVYGIVRNEARTGNLVRWARHYRSFCSRLVVYDDASDDETSVVCHTSGVELRRYPGSGIDDGAFVDLANEVYKEARGCSYRRAADYVIWADADELIWWPGSIAEQLERLKGRKVAAPRVMGFQMIGEGPWGFPDPAYDKPMVVDPFAEVQWTVGRHSAIVNGEVVRPRNGLDLAMLHYRYQSREFLEARNAENQSRLTAHEKAQGWGPNQQAEFYEQAEWVNVIEYLERAA